jgi:NAD(P)-dependent dehydrogenase (short-subunit alcohol dehydrogenase family)
MTVEPSIADPIAQFRLDDRVVLVTGASSGFGARFARVAAAAGAKVVVTARRLDRLEAVAAELPDALPVACDVADEGACRDLVGATIDRYGRVDVLVNNAGLSDAPDKAEADDLENFRRVVDVNLSACFHLAALCGRDMITRSSGSIINIGSVHSHVGSAPNAQAAYVATKHGLLGLTRDLALQWARHRVRVNLLCPGYFETELTKVMFDDERMTDWIRRGTPFRRGGDPHELDGAFLFLASDASTYVTGASLAVDGGWTAR